MQLCRKCGTRLDAVSEGQEYHPFCTPQHAKLPGTDMSIFEMEVREDLLEIIQWGNQSSARTQQVTLGCSEAGNKCERRIAYTMAGVPKVNFPDPLKANIGTAYHTWLDHRTSEYQQVNGTSEWVTETEVWPAEFLKGHVDLYSSKRRLVLDWKTTSKTILAEWRKTGIPHEYMVQIMLYGKGMINAGFPVDRVGLVPIDRSGALRDVKVYTVPYDEEFALSALRRVWKIGKKLNDMGETPDFGRLEFHADYVMCGYCPFYRGGTKPADSTGCPGRTTGDPVQDLFDTQG